MDVIVEERLVVLLQRLLQRVVKRAACCDVEVAGTAADHGFVALERAVRKAESRLEARLGRGPQTGRKTGLRIAHHGRAADAIDGRARSVRVVDAGSRAGVDVGQLFCIERARIPRRVDELPGAAQGAEVAIESVGGSQCGVKFIAQAVAEVELWSNLPRVLSEERIAVGAGIIVRTNVVALVLVRHAQQEVGELIAGGAIGLVEGEIAVVDGRGVSARLGVCEKVAEVEAGAQHMTAARVGQRVDVLEDSRTLVEAKSLADRVHVRETVVEHDVRQAVEERRDADLKACALREAGAVEGIRIAILLQREAELELVHEMRRNGVVQAA